MAKDNSNNPDDDGSPALKEAEAKEGALASYFTSLKLGYNILSASLKSRDADRTATQSARPMKDTPVDQMSAGSGVDPSLARSSPPDRNDNDTGDTNSGSDTGGSTGDSAGSGDTGSTGSSSGDTGGGPSIAPAPDSGYVSFADTATVTQQDSKATAKSKSIDPAAEQAEKSQMKQDTKNQNAKAPGTAAPAQTAPSSKGGGTGGPSTGPGPGGGKGGSGASPGVGL